MNPSEQIDCLLAKIRDWLVDCLDEKILDMKVASEIAKATLILFPENMDPGKYQEAVSQLEQMFPKQYAAIHAASLSCKLDHARVVLDREVLGLIAAGDLDAALVKVNQFDLT
jgi:hypothetical protein